jgi:putative transcriptional regulator
MMGDVRELLPLYALGMLESDEVMVVERAVAADAELAAELVAYQQTADEIIGVAIEPVAPSPDVQQRLFASIGGGRFEAFSARMARLFDVTVDRARELLGLIERPASWVPQIPGISLVHFEGGPAATAADCGFIRLTPGAVFPPHTHLGEEAVTILSGRIHDVTNDRMVVAGDDYVQPEGTSHYLICVGDEDCIFASRAMNGIAIGGSRARPQKN